MLGLRGLSTGKALVSAGLCSWFWAFAGKDSVVGGARLIAPVGSYEVRAAVAEMGRAKAIIT